MAQAMMGLGNQQPIVAGDIQQSVREEHHRMMEAGSRPQVTDLHSAFISQILFHSLCHNRMTQVDQSE